MTNYNDGKIHGWNGGDCPVHPETVVEYWTRDRGACHCNAGDLDWSHCGKGFDIIAFRVVKEYVEPKVIWVNEYPAGGDAYDTEILARSLAAEGILRIAVKYQEVIE